MGAHGLCIFIQTEIDEDRRGSAKTIPRVKKQRKIRLFFFFLCAGEIARKLCRLRSGISSRVEGNWALAALVAGLAATVAVGVSLRQIALLGLVAGLAAVEAPPAVVTTGVASPRCSGFPFRPFIPIRSGLGSSPTVAITATRFLGATRSGLVTLGVRGILNAMASRLPTSPPERKERDAKSGEVARSER